MTAPTNKLRGLYAITPQNTTSLDDWLTPITIALRNGVSILQYRDKSTDPVKRAEEASELRRLTEQYNTLLIINDDIELASSCRADGVHLGKNDQGLLTARSALGPNAIIGISCYDDPALAKTAVENSADYVAFGAFYPSPTKPNAALASVDSLTQSKALDIPICAIGGITLGNAKPLIDHGADMIAVISTLWNHKDIAVIAKKLSHLFKN